MTDIEAQKSTIIRAEVINSETHNKSNFWKYISSVIIISTFIYLLISLNKLEKENEHHSHVGEEINKAVVSEFKNLNISDGIEIEVENNIKKLNIKNGNDGEKGEKGDKGDPGEVLYIPNPAEEYDSLPVLPGSNQIGVSFDLKTFSTGGSLLEESYDERKETGLFSRTVFKVPTYIGTINQEQSTTASAETNIYTSYDGYMSAQLSTIGADVSYIAIGGASGNKNNQKAKVGMSVSGTYMFLTQSIAKVGELFLKNDLYPYFKKGLKDKYENLPLFPEAFDKTNLTHLEILADFEAVFTQYPPYIVHFITKGGMIQAQSFLSNAREYCQQFSVSKVIASINFGWGPWAGSVSTTTTTLTSSETEEVMKNTVHSTSVIGGDNIGNADDPAQSVTNAENWTDYQFQNWFGWIQKNPSRIGFQINEISIYFPDDIRRNLHRGIKYIFGKSENDMIDIMAETNKVQVRLDELKSEIIDDSKQIQDELDQLKSKTVSFGFGPCRDVSANVVASLNTAVNYPMCRDYEIPRNIDVKWSPNIGGQRGYVIQAVLCCQVDMS